MIDGVARFIIEADDQDRALELWTNTAGFDGVTTTSTGVAIATGPTGDRSDGACRGRSSPGAAR
jgi:hypothetical protein